MIRLGYAAALGSCGAAAASAAERSFSGARGRAPLHWESGSAAVGYGVSGELGTRL